MIKIIEEKNSNIICVGTEAKMPMPISRKTNCVKVEGTPAKLLVPNLGPALEITKNIFQKNPLAKEKHPKHHPPKDIKEVHNATVEQEETMDKTVCTTMPEQKEIVDKMTKLVIEVDKTAIATKKLDKDVDKTAATTPITVMKEQGMAVDNATREEDKAVDKSATATAPIDKKEEYMAVTKTTNTAVFEEEDMEEEMLRILVSEEKRLKEERLRKVEDLKKKEEEELCKEIDKIEKRYDRKKLADAMTSKAREQAAKDDQDWIILAEEFEEMKRLEMDDYLPSSPPPFLPAKMPQGEESWGESQEGRKQESRGSRDITAAKEPSVGSKEPEGAAKVTNYEEIEDRPKVPSHMGEQDKTAMHTPTVTEPVAVFGQKEMLLQKSPPSSPLPPSRARKAAKTMDAKRRSCRSKQMSSSRNLENTDAPLTPIRKANPEMQRLTSLFRTSSSPLKMPNIPPASSRMSVSSTMSHTDVKANKAYHPCVESPTSSKPKSLEAGNKQKRMQNQPM